METLLSDELYYYVQADNGNYVGLQPVDLRPKKKRRLNPTGENVYLLPDGTLKWDKDLVVMCQRMWLHKAYKPGGIMYRKFLESTSVGLRWDQNGSCTTPSEPSAS
jgi:hypothetical protein